VLSATESTQEDPITHANGAFQAPVFEAVIVEAVIVIVVHDIATKSKKTDQP
jgi:hypothetical protein